MPPAATPSEGAAPAKATRNSRSGLDGRRIQRRKGTGTLRYN